MSYFPGNLSDNPSVRVDKKNTVLAGVKRLKTEVDASSSSRDGYKSTDDTVVLGFYGQSFFVDGEVYAKDKYSNLDYQGTEERAYDYSGRNFNLGTSAFLLADMAVTYNSVDKKIISNGEKVKKESLGGGVRLNLGAIGIGTFGNLVKESGYNVAESQWLELGAGFGFRSSNFMLEYYLSRSPEVRQVDSSGTTAYGGKLGHHIVIEHFNPVSPYLNRFRAKFSMIKTDQTRNVDTYQKDTLIELQAGGKIEGGLGYSLGYDILKHQYQSAELKGKSISISLVYSP